MEQRKRYRIVVSAILALAVCVGPIPCHGMQTGTVTSLSEKVYESMDTGSGVVANVIMDSPFTLLSAEYDGAGNVWYRIRTDTGTEGYLPAQNVVVAGQGGTGNEDEQAPEEDGRPGDSPEDGRPEEAADGREDVPDQAAAEPDVPEAENGEATEGGRDGQPEIVSQDLLIPEGAGQEAADPGGTRKQARTIEAVNMREEPSTDAQIMVTIPPDVTLDCIGTEENGIGEIWYEVAYEEVRGYIREGTVEMTEAAMTDTAEEPEGSGQDPQAEGAAGGARDDGPETPQERGQIQEGTSPGGDAASLEEGDGKMRYPSQWFWMDWVTMGAFAGCLVCACIFCHLARQMTKIYRGRDRKERKKECSPRKRKRHP